MQVIVFIETHKDLINIAINLLMALGTISAVIVALHLGYKDSHPKLKISGLVSILFDNDNNIKYLHLCCINSSKQPVIVKSFSLSPTNVKKQPQRLMLVSKDPNLSTPLPKKLEYSDDANLYFRTDFLKDPAFKKFLGSYKFLAWLKLKFFWRVVAFTNVGEFEGKLYNSLIEEILAANF
jgi:hypothetical protein